MDAPARLGTQAITLLQDPTNELMLGACTIWELAIKVSLGKLTLSLPFRRWMTQALDDLQLSLLAITVEYADVQAGLARHHGDPFDRLLVAQATVEQVVIVSNDSALEAYGINRLW